VAEPLLYHPCFCLFIMHSVAELFLFLTWPYLAQYSVAVPLLYFLYLLNLPSVAGPLLCYLLSSILYCTAWLRHFCTVSSFYLFPLHCVAEPLLCLTSGLVSILVQRGRATSVHTICVFCTMWPSHSCALPGVWYLVLYSVAEPLLYSIIPI